MSIIYNQEAKTFHLKSKKTSYLLKVVETRHIIHLYWGKRINTDNIDYSIREMSTVLYANTDNLKNFRLEAMLQEFPSYGSTDLRSPAVELQFDDGTTATDLRYENHEIYLGKKPLTGLPSTYAEENTEVMSLDLVLMDHLKNIKVIVTYNVFEKIDVITRSVKVINLSRENVRVLRLLSANVDFKDSEFDLIQLSGCWAREREFVRASLKSGGQSIESRRGASSHAQNPFMALARKNVSEIYGDVYGFSLIYSGNFLANVEVDMYYQTRAQIGINPFDFSWLLESGEELQGPEVAMVYSSDGLTGMSHKYHNLYRNRLIRGKYRNIIRPIVINTWEGIGFNFDEVKIYEMAKEAASMGIELFVLDDGWFGNRNDDTSSLGDWFVNEDKIKGGLSNLVEKINDMGLKFGLWFEPEMISPKSKLYEEHPDWCIHIPGRTRSEARNQLILDLSRDKVCDYIIKVVSDILSSANISYVKWDMNRNMTEVGSIGLSQDRQRETAHRYMLGLYRVMAEITSRFPNILFESCSGGGGRFDPGMLYYMPQIWTSDNTDPIERLKIQFGTSLVYPNISMTAHVSESPNSITQRNTPLQTNAIVAMAGNFGYELDITKLSDDERKLIKDQITLYKEIRETVQFGLFYRLLYGNEVAWMFISQDGNEVIVSYVKVLARPSEFLGELKLVALDEKAVYEVIDEGITIGGDELMYIGLNITLESADYYSKLWRLRKK